MTFDLDIEKDIPEYLEFAQYLADLSGDVAKKYFKNPELVIEAKANMSPVSIADKKIEEMLREEISKKYPEHGLFGEEYGRARYNESSLKWILDPIDGTTSFVAGIPVFGILISLAYYNTPILGIIDQPILHERFVGVKNKQSTLNKSPINTRNCKKLEDAVFSTTNPFYFDEGKEWEFFMKIKNQAKSACFGNDCYAYAMLASGNVDVVIENKLKPYDFAALIPVIEGSGGIVTTWEGNSVTIDSNGYIIACATKELHEQVISFL